MQVTQQLGVLHRPLASALLLKPARRSSPVSVCCSIACRGVSMQPATACPGPSKNSLKRRRDSVLREAAPQNKKPATSSSSQQDSSGPGLWLIVGLGNPGATYERTRHNVGFMLIDLLAKQEGIDCRKLEKSAAVGRGVIAGQQVLLAKPVTFMNNSGESVSALARFYKVPTQRILVVSDDLDMPHAALRLRAKGGHGGHNGLRSISERLGNTQDYPRLKLGIGRPAGQLPIASWVLQDFTPREMEDMQVTLHQAADVVRMVLTQGVEKAVSQANPSTSKPSAPSKAAAPKTQTGPVQQQQQQQQPKQPSASPQQQQQQQQQAKAAPASTVVAAVSSTPVRS